MERTQRVKDTNHQLNMAMKLNCEFSEEKNKNGLKYLEGNNDAITIISKSKKKT